MLDIVQLSATLEAYCRINGGLLKQQAFNSLQSIEKGINLIAGIKDEYSLAVPFINNIVQKGNAQSINNTTDPIGFEPRVLKLRKWKVDLKIIPQEYEDTYLGYSLRAGSDPYQIPFEMYILDLIVSQVREDAENIIWNGVYNAAPAGAGVADTLTVADGFRRKIANAITALTLAPVTTGVITNVNAVASLRTLWKSLDDRLKYKPGTKLYASPSICIAYSENYQSINNALPYNNEFGKTTLDISNGTCELVPITALAGSGRVIIDPANVLTIGTDATGDLSNIIVERRDRGIQFLMDGKIGTELVVHELGGMQYLAVNEQV